MDRRISKIRTELQTKLRKLSIEEHNLRKHGLYGPSNRTSKCKICTINN